MAGRVSNRPGATPSGRAANNSTNTTRMQEMDESCLNEGTWLFQVRVSSAPHGVFRDPLLLFLYLLLLLLILSSFSQTPTQKIRNNDQPLIVHQLLFDINRTSFPPVAWNGHQGGGAGNAIPPPAPPPPTSNRLIPRRHVVGLLNFHSRWKMIDFGNGPRRFASCSSSAARRQQQQQLCSCWGSRCSSNKRTNGRKESQKRNKERTGNGGIVESYR